MKIIRSSPAILLASMVLRAAAAAPATQAPTAPKNYPDIEYANVDGVSLKLDACVPDGDGPFPVAILVHGGGWSSGDRKTEFAVLFKPLSDAHFVWFSIEYRLAPQYPWPACFEDMQNAIRWVKSHASQYKGDPNRIATIGYSAGGELVCLAAVQAHEDTHVAAVVGFAPPTDLEADTQRRGGLSTSLKNLFGTTTINDSVQVSLKQMSPIDYIGPGLPPFLFVQGNADKSVMYPQTLAFQARLKAAGVPTEFITIDKGPHDVTKWLALDRTYKSRVIAWLRRTLGP